MGMVKAGEICNATQEQEGFSGLGSVPKNPTKNDRTKARKDSFSLCGLSQYGYPVVMRYSEAAIMASPVLVWCE